VHDLSPAQLRRGLETMTVGQDAFPPGPRAFRKLCLAGDGDAVRTGIHALYLPEPPKAPMDRDQVVAGLAALRASLPRDEPPVAEYLPAVAWLSVAASWRGIRRPWWPPAWGGLFPPRNWNWPWSRSRGESTPWTWSARHERHPTRPP
jgi:hypothetical protein